MNNPDLSTLTLSRGSHKSRADGVCAMEVVAWLAGEPHSDRPQNTCPIIAAFVRRWNDDLDDEDRNRLLLPLLPLLVGSRSTPEVENRRALLAIDWQIRTSTPAWLDLVPDLAQHAAALRALPEVNEQTAEQAMGVALAAKAAAKAAAVGAAWGTAEATALAAAGAAAVAAAWAAAGAAARTAALDAAVAAARTAAKGAAGDAAEATLTPTVATLQRSAVALIGRMIAVSADNIQETT